MSRERLQKVLARAGVASRRRVEEMIREGRVVLNGKPAELGDRADLREDSVKVDGKRIKPSQRPHVYLLVNKPRAVVSTADDPEERKTVLDLVPERLHKGLVPVGRLDYDSEGLLLLTDDGDFAHRVSHPRFGCVKTYEVKVKGTPKPGDIDRLRRGIRLDGRMTAPARVSSFSGPEGKRETSTGTWWRVAIGEGRNRQIRDMFLRIGHPVQRLRRVAIGSVSDPRLARGSWRDLTPEEIAGLREGSSKAPTLAKGRRPPKPRRAEAQGTGRRRGKSPAREEGPRGRSGGRSGTGKDRSAGPSKRTSGPRRGPGKGSKRPGRG